MSYQTNQNKLGCLFFLKLFLKNFFKAIVSQHTDEFPQGVCSLVHPAQKGGCHRETTCLSKVSLLLPIGSHRSYFLVPWDTGLSGVLQGRSPTGTKEDLIKFSLKRGDFNLVG